MKQQIIAFTGLSGVGKTTFLRQLATRVQFQHLTGGSLIAAARSAHADDRDMLRHANLDENQRLLIDGFALARDPASTIIVMDGHVVIDSGKSLGELPVEVFQALGITKMIHLETEPARIFANRSRDISRKRPSHCIETLSQHQFSSRLHANFIAITLNVEFRIVTHEDVENLASTLVMA